MLQYHRDRRKVLNIHLDGMGRVEERVHMTKTQMGERERRNRTECRGISSSFDANIFGLPLHIYKVQMNQRNTYLLSFAQIDQNNEKLTENGFWV